MSTKKTSSLPNPDKANEEGGRQKRSLAERKERAIDDLSYEILMNPPDKYVNGAAIGFAPYFTTQFGLPHSRVDGSTWKRRNGNQILTIMTDCEYGLPSGNKPRLLLLWVATWQVRHPSQTVIELGKNVTQFMRDELNLPVTGQYIKNVRLEMIRLFSAVVSIVTDDHEAMLYKRQASMISENFELWGSRKMPDQDSLYASWIELHPKFRESILAKPIPIDMRAIRHLAPSSLALDYYVWLARTMFSLKTSRFVPWKALHDQFGSQYDWTNRNSRFKFRAESKRLLMERVWKVYPDLRVSFPDDKEGMILHPSPTPVPAVPSNRSKLYLTSPKKS